MRKIFVTNMSLQSRSDLGQVLYNPKGFDLNNNRKTRFPIIPIIAEYLEEGDEVKVIVLRLINEDTKDNLERLYEELQTLNIGREQVKVIESEENQERNSELKLFLELLSELDGESIAFYDITFGTKPLSALLLYAASYSYELKETQIGGIYYGEIPRKDGKPIPEAEGLYDMTYMVSFGDLIHNLKEIECENPENMIHRLLDL